MHERNGACPWQPSSHADDDNWRPGPVVPRIPIPGPRKPTGRAS
ncbi:hypothetical protein ABZ883_04835 [Streptomyces sp. NPDC046977]